MKYHFFKNFEFEFETTRLLWYTPSGGSDFGEVATVSEKIIDSNYESWYLEWSKFAKKLEERANKFKSNISKGDGFLRASRYYQASEFFLSPTDVRKLVVYNKSIELFYAGLNLKEIDFEMNEIEYNNVTVRSVFFATNKVPKGTLFVCGGFDALLEELYFTNVQQGIENGYNVVIFEGPGQSNIIRKFNSPFEENWNNVTKIVLEFYENNYDITGKKIGIGLSLGGLLIARAASLDKTLFDKIILFNYFPSMLDSFKKSMPKFLYKYIDNGFPYLLEKICSYYISHHKFLNWQIEHAKWTFGESSLNSLIERCKKFNEIITLEQLSTDTLVFLAENENYYDYKLGINFYSRIKAVNKKMILFNKDNFSSNLHCQNGAFYDANNQIFEWLN